MKRILVYSVMVGSLLVALHLPVSGSFRVGPMLEPMNGLWSTARAARPWVSETVKLDGMQDSVRITMDNRGVPHIKASSDQDAMVALGYVVVRDRLFQADFIHRVSTGRLAELLGEEALSIDQHFYRNGIVHAVRRNTRLMADRMPREFKAVESYVRGANAWLSQLDPEDYPLEYRLLDAQPPDSITSEFTMALYAYMAYDLSFRSTDRSHAFARASMGDAMFQRLYPEYSIWEKPIIQAGEGWWAEYSGSSGDNGVESGQDGGKLSMMAIGGSVDHERHVVAETGSVSVSGESRFKEAPSWQEAIMEGFTEGKGSNNWAVSGSRSATGMPILAGDMHLSLTLPAIWYEAHLITPTTNVYGVTFPAVPGIVEGITPTTAWAFTNTGSDQLDTYRIELSDDGRQYRYDDTWLDLEVQRDTIRVRDGEEQVIEVPFTHFGPVLREDDGDFVIRWVGHEFGTTFAAVWDMNRARNYEEFERATRQWDYPMQNILYAGTDSIIAIRSTGYMPVRGQGNAFGVMDGSTSDTEWIGRVPFDELPFSIEPSKGYLASTNQRPASDGYPHYLGQDWYSIHRSVRIDALLSGKSRHTVDDVASYQGDQVALQVGLFTQPLLDLEDLSPNAHRLREVLLSFDGSMSTDAIEGHLFDMYFESLRALVWDEDVFAKGAEPQAVRILELLQSDTAHVWFDRADTPARETGPDIFRAAIEQTAQRWAETDYTDVPWGEVQTLQLRHITGAEPLRALWREGFPYGGYRETLSPARTNPVRFSASWRVVVDLSTSPPQARGIYPGGQSGNPFSPLYDTHLQKFVDFEYYSIDLNVGY